MRTKTFLNREDVMQNMGHEDGMESRPRRREFKTPELKAAYDYGYSEGKRHAAGLERDKENGEFD